jgi:hypothetical protein
MKAVVIKQRESEESGRKDPSFWSLVEQAKAGFEQASDELRKHPKVVKMILVICISLMRGKDDQDYEDIEALQKEVGLRIRRNITSFEGENEREFGKWLWRVTRSHPDDKGRNVKKENLMQWWASLSDRERRILKLRIDGYEIEEIGEMLPKRELKSQVRRDLMKALKKLELIAYRWQDTGFTEKAGKKIIEGEKPWKRKVKKKAQSPV